MKINHKYVLSLVLFCLHFSIFANNGLNRGLRFSSSEVDQDNRTGLNLSPDNRIATNNGFTLKFDIQLHKKFYNFGYVFRIVGADNTSIDLVADLLSDEFLFSLVTGEKSKIKVKRQDLKNFQQSTWLTLVVDYNQKNNLITLKVNDFEKSQTFKSDKFSSVDIFFGINKSPVFATTDVPPMTIRDIKIYNEDKLLKYNWQLEKHALNKVFDEIQGKKATAINPSWEIDKHVKWQAKARIIIPYELPQLAYDEVNGRIFFAKHKAIYRFDVQTNTIDSLTARNGEVYNCRANQMFYDNNSRKLFSYSFDNANLAYFDFNSLEWSNESTVKITPQFWHHCKYFDATDSTLITFGGYGYHKYKADVMRYSFKNKEWKQHDISSKIPPRYLSSMGLIDGNNLLYFGGYGSKTGNQEEFPHNYYDLYRVNFKTLEVTKLWEMDAADEHVVNGNSLVVNKGLNTFYNLTYSNTRYSTNLQLNEYAINKPEFKPVGDTIPYKFKDIESYCDLYYSAKTAELIAVTSVSKNNKTELSIYSIAYPPLSTADILQQNEAHRHWEWWLLLLPLMLAPAWYVTKVQKAKKKRMQKSVNAYLNYEYHTSKIQLKPSSINLLGLFQLIDKEGVNITGNFTATTSQMLIIITLYSIKNGQGISTQELTDILWPDKDTDSARNNRNVYMSKLRLLVKNVGDVELVNQNNYWSITIGNDVFCDYKNVLYLIDQVKKQKDSSAELLNELFNIASRGVLLPNIQEEWVDSFKADYTSLVIETLTSLLEKKEILSDPIQVMRLCDAILKHDNIDEEIVKLKVTKLYELGKMSQAKQCFDKFTDEYKNFMGIAYKFSFDQFRETNL